MTGRTDRERGEIPSFFLSPRSCGHPLGTTAVSADSWASTAVSAVSADSWGVTAVSADASGVTAVGSVSLP